MNQKRLSITIPTWNRAHLLKELMDELVSQVKMDRLENQIEILVSDNGSEDNTRELVSSLIIDNDFIVYHSNGVNKGARFNVLNCFDLANADFLILFGDDDRPSKGAIKRILEFLDSFPETGFLFDSHYFKRNPFGDSTLTNEQLLGNFYYYLGNAGGFIIRTKFLKEVLAKTAYDFFSPTWPQTQVFVIAANNHPESEIRINDLSILSQGKHEEVMIYTSYYLWRTTYIDLIDAVIVLRESISRTSLQAAREYFNRNVNQLFFNILQCGVFVDDSSTRIKTAKSIFQNIGKLSVKEKLFMAIAGFVLFLPGFLSSLLSNVFIYLLRGKNGILKKNSFVNSERLKRERKMNTTGSAIREFDFKNV